MNKELGKYKALICPCCNKERFITQFTRLEQFNKQYRFEYLKSVFQSAKEGFIYWACDPCLKSKHALLGNPELQNWGGFAHPYYMFYDQKKVCSTCKQQFVFKKEEQQYWFEELKFTVWSEAKDCLQCRKSKRIPKERNKKISTLIKHLEEDNIDQIETLIDLYLEINKMDKAKFHLALVRKNSDYRINHKTRQRIAQLEAKITANT